MKVYIIQKVGEDIIDVYGDKQTADKVCRELNIKEGHLDDDWYLVEEYDVIKRIK